MNYCVINSEMVITNIIVCENDKTASEFNAFPSYKDAKIGEKYIVPTLEATPSYIGTGKSLSVILVVPQNASSFILSDNESVVLCNQGASTINFENEIINVKWYKNKIVLGGDKINVKDKKYYIVWF